MSFIIIGTTYTSLTNLNYILLAIIKYTLYNYRGSVTMTKYHMRTLDEQASDSKN